MSQPWPRDSNETASDQPGAVQLELAADGKSVTAVIVFEDKATDNARKTIREEVWPGIVALEAGERVSELTHQTTAMLEATAEA
jgi:hypothetical protein